MAVQPWQKGVITRIHHETPTTSRFWITVPELSTFDFKPGQFVTLDLPIHEKTNKRQRSYSIASWPDGTNTFELVIVILPEGPGTNYLFNEVFEGTELTLKGPQGVFTLPDPIETDLYFICTGTGIAPFRSMIHYINQHKVAHKNLYLLFGTRHKADLLYYDEFIRLEQEVSSFNYLPSLSREKWEGCFGYVHEIYENVIHQKMIDSGNLPPAKFYLCGWKNMIDEAKRRIQHMGYDRKAIHQELYG